MIDPLFWLGLSILLVAVSLTAVLVAALPALKELARAARSAEKLFDTLNRELPPTLEAIRLTGMEISDLTDDVSEGVQSAGRVVKQIDQSVSGVRSQAKRAQSTTRSLVVGIKAAWKTFSKGGQPRRSPDRLPGADRPSKDLENDYPALNAASRPLVDSYEEDYEEDLYEESYDLTQHSIKDEQSGRKVRSLPSETEISPQSQPSATTPRSSSASENLSNED